MTRSAAWLAAVGANYAFDPAAAFEPNHPHVAHDVDAVAAMLVGKILRHAGRDHAIHDPIGHFQHRDLAVHRAAGRRGLEADVAAADDDDPASGFDSRLDGRDVLEAAQIVHAGQRGPGARQAARFRAHTQQQAVIGQHLARDLDLPRGGIDSHRPAVPI